MTEDHEKQYWPALDGVRAIAIIAVVAYHLGHLGGGWIGVDVFFVLSGYLITTLILSERRSDGRTALRRFWFRRARRLLPAVLLLLLVLGIYAWVGGPGVVPAQLRSPGIATLFYFANWQQIAFSHNYFAAFTTPTPLVHTWSLAIEEQYYVVWPLLVVAVGAVATRWWRRRGRQPKTVPSGGAPRGLLIVTVLLLGASVVAMGLVAHLVSVNRAYLGTDTRAWELLVGATAAMVVRPSRSARHSGRWAVASAAGVVVGGTVIGLASLASASGNPPSWVWDGGLAAAALGAAALITGSVRAPDGPVARVLSVRPARWLGRVSYSLYLWHWPVIDLVTPGSIGLSGAGLLAVRLGLMLGATCVSYYLVERPLRRLQWTTLRSRAMALAGIGGTTAVILAATVAPPLAGTASIATTPSGHHRQATSDALGSTTPASLQLPGLDFSTAHPLRMWILGDSVMEDSSPGVTAALQATGKVNVVINSSYGGWGLTRVNWQNQSNQTIAQYQPQVIMGTWSWDNQMAAAQPAAYEQLLHAAVAQWLTPGNGVDLVVLLQFPQTGPSPLYFQNPPEMQRAWAVATADEKAWDAIARKVVLQFPGHALYFSTDQLFAPRGRFFSWFKTPGGTWIRARKVDAAHMCPYGAAEFGQLILNDLDRTLDLGAPAPGWQYGSWTTDPRYNDPAGACPNDQPPAHYLGLAVPGPVVARPAVHKR